MAKNKIKIGLLVILTMCMTLFSGCMFSSVAVLPTNEDGNVDVVVGDQYSQSASGVMRRIIQPLTFDGTQTINNNSIQVLDATGVTIGNIITIQEDDFTVGKS